MPTPTKLQLPELTIAELVMPRDVAYATGHATQKIAEQGWYINTKGQSVDIQALRDAATRGRVAYRPGQTPIIGTPRHDRLHTYMYNQTTLTVAEARIAQGYSVAILNFASATTPGGGWLVGARAQEESLARSSTLVHALRDDPMYADPSHHTNPFYDDTVIVTQNVPFFRRHNGQLRDTPWQADVITCAAVHAHAVRCYESGRAHEIEPTMQRRTEKVFHVATTLDADILILGAWGCGAFGNDEHAIARIMHDTLQLVDMRRYTAIDFAVADLRASQPLFSAFAQWFDDKVFGG